MILVFAAGCVNNAGVAVLSANDMVFALADASNIEVHPFQLGDIELMNAGGQSISAPLDGIISIPSTEGPHPVVVIFHGARRISSIREHMYAGFDYLVRQLAAEGFAAISINVLVNYTFEMGEPLVHNEWAMDLFDGHISFLENANAGQDVGHGIYLTNKLDLSQIHLIGHSRGGEVANCIVLRDINNNIERIQSIIRVGTTVIFEEGDIFHPDIPTGIIIPEFDGDVLSHDGHLVFDEILHLGQNQSIASLVYLRGANHNFFNRDVLVDDRVDSMNAAHLAVDTWLTREEQEDFLMRYAAAFLSVVTNASEPWGVFAPSASQPNTMFGYAVTASTYIPGRLRVLALPSEDAAHRYITTTGPASAFYYEQAIPLYSAGLFNHPAALGRHNRRPMYALEWEAGGGTVSFALGENDFTAHSSLALYVAVDSSNQLNPQGEYQSFTLVITDSDGNNQGITIPMGTSPLAFHPGYAWDAEWFDGETRQFWVGFMPFGELRIPLSYFYDINLSAVAKVGIVFDQTQSGAVMLSGIYLK